jgi:hypothetical protein
MAAGTVKTDLRMAQVCELQGAKIDDGVRIQCGYLQNESLSMVHKMRGRNKWV